MVKISKFSTKQKFEVLYDCCIRRATTLTRLSEIHMSTTYRYLERIEKEGTLERHSGSGGKNKTTKKVERKVIQKVKNSKNPLTMPQVARKCGVSTSTARRIAKREGFTYKKIKNSTLSVKAKSDREKFCRFMLNQISDVPFTIWSDETSFWLNKSRPSHAWVMMGEDPPFEGRSKLHQGKVHVWGAISSRGTVSLSIFKENMNSQMYVDILKKKTQEMKNLYPEGFVFMQDNDPKHKANITKNYLYKNFMDVLDWPAYSPDLNPIENIWGWLKAMVSKEIPQNLDDLEKIIKKHWKSITPMMIQPYIDGMEQRFRDVLSKHGGYINK